MEPSKSEGFHTGPQPALNCFDSGVFIVIT